MDELTAGASHYAHTLRVPSLSGSPAVSTPRTPAKDDTCHDAQLVPVLGAVEVAAHLRFLAAAVARSATGKDVATVTSGAVMHPEPRPGCGDSRRCGPDVLAASVLHAATVTVNALAGCFGGEGSVVLPDAGRLEVMIVPAAVEIVSRLVAVLGNGALVNAEMVACLAIVDAAKYLSDDAVDVSQVPAALGISPDKFWECEIELLRALDFDVGGFDEDRLEAHAMAAMGVTWW